MRDRLKRAIAPLLALMLILAMLLPVHAASKKTISSVKLKVDCGKEPEAGEDVGSVTVTASNGDKYDVGEAEYYDTKGDVWKRGEVPVIRVELTAKDFDNEKFSSSTKVTVSGFHSSVKARKVLDNGETLRVDIKLRAVGGVLGEVGDCYWDRKTAVWEESDGANKYEVKLYRGGTTVATVTTAGRRYNFNSHMTKSGDYSFRVRPINTSDGSKGEWSDKSDEFYVSPSDVYTGAQPTGSGGSGSSGGTGPSGGPASGIQAGWSQDAHGWTYHLEGGTQVRGSWIYVDDNWFYIGGDGYMMTDWIYVDNNWFYLNPISDGTRGAMKTGWQNIGGVYYYLNPVSDGTRGAMKTGWQNIDGVYYYFNPISDGTKGARKSGFQNIDGRLYFLDSETGALWVNRTAPNGRWADANGVIN